jgi:hypothetical protein
MKALLVCIGIFLGGSASAAEGKKDELPALPTDVVLKSGAILRKVSVVRWEKDRVVVKHAGGIDPVRYDTFSPAHRAIFEQHRPGALAAKVADDKAAANRANAEQEAYTKSLQDQIRWEDMAAKKKIEVGMSQALLIKAWGKPIRINASSQGADQWVYPNQQYVYVEDGKIRSWQSPK